MDFNKYYKLDINIDLFKLQLPNFNEILSDILQNDDLDKFVQLLLELKMYEDLYKSNDNPTYMYCCLTGSKNEYDYEIENKIVLKRIKKKYNELVKQNLKSESCKIIRFIIKKQSRHQIHGMFLHILNKLKIKFTENQRFLISEAILHSCKLYPSKIANELVINSQSHIRKGYFIGKEILKKIEYLKNKQQEINSEYQRIRTTLSYVTHTSPYKKYYKQQKSIPIFYILNPCIELIKLPKELRNIYLDSIRELYFIMI